MNSSGVTAASHFTSKPEDLKARLDSSISSLQSSKKSTRSGLGVFSSDARPDFILRPSVASRLGRRLVHQQPVVAQPFDGIPELVEINRLLNVAVAAQPVALHQIVFL